MKRPQALWAGGRLSRGFCRVFGPALQAGKRRRSRSYPSPSRARQRGAREAEGQADDGRLITLRRRLGGSPCLTAWSVPTPRSFAGIILSACSLSKIRSEFSSCSTRRPVAVAPRHQAGQRLPKAQAQHFVDRVGSREIHPVNRTKRCIGFDLAHRIDEHQ